MKDSRLPVRMLNQSSQLRPLGRPRGRWLAAAVVTLGLFDAANSPALRAADNSEELRLRNGNVLKGQFVEGDKQTIVFRSDSGLQSFPKKDVRAIIFEVEPAGTGGEFPPGFTAKPPHKLKRLVVTRRITQNRATEEQNYEPEVIGISFQHLNRFSNDNAWFMFNGNESGGWDALQGDHQLRDDSKNGDAVAGDGIYSTDNLSPHPTDYRLPEGRYLLRIVAHDDQNAVAVDVDGVEIK